MGMSDAWILSTTVEILMWFETETENDYNDLSTTVEILMWFETLRGCFNGCKSTTVEILMWFETQCQKLLSYYLQQ